MVEFKRKIIYAREDNLRTIQDLLDIGWEIKQMSAAADGAAINLSTGCYFYMEKEEHK